MIKKAYLKPVMMVEKVQHSQIICTSVTDIKASGLDDEESLDYGDEDKKSGSVWEEAW